jgi:hypothetical protein
MTNGGQTHRDNIEAQLGGMFTTHTTEGTITGGTFTYNESDMRTIINNWRDLSASYQKSMTNADIMARIEPPAEDFASRSHTAAANRSATSYRTYLEHNQHYCDEQADLFQRTLDEYLGIEHKTTTEMNQTAPEGPQSGV